MGYQRKHYNALTEAYKKRFNLKNQDLTHGQWMGIINEITSIFDDGILITEALDAFDEASYQKKNWPIGKVFFKRVHDVVLKNRFERSRESPVRVDGIRSMKEIIQERINRQRNGTNT